jgi:hypothetical protein
MTFAVMANERVVNLMPNILSRLELAANTNPAEALKLLPELLRAVHEGTIIELPCKIGDTVYKIVNLMNGKIIIVEGKMVEYSKDVVKEEFYFSEPTRYHDIWCDSEYFGETVFLTREAAEERLESEKNE